MGGDEEAEAEPIPPTYPQDWLSTRCPIYVTGTSNASANETNQSDMEFNIRRVGKTCEAPCTEKILRPDHHMDQK